MGLAGVCLNGDKRKKRPVPVDFGVVLNPGKPWRD